MAWSWRASGVTVLLGVAACGPPRLLSSSGDGDANENDEDTGAGETTAPIDEGSDEGSDEDTQDPTTGTTSLTFLPGHDVSSLVECDPFEQDCPDGEKCVPYGSTGSTWDAFKCVPVLGDQASGEPCTHGGLVEATDDCDELSHCWDVDDVEGEPVGTCHTFCSGTEDNPQCPPMSQCLISSNGTPALCISICDPVVQDCGAGRACFWANDGFNCLFTTEDIPPGEPCGYVNDCAVGSNCTTAEVMPNCAGSACCSPFCHLMLGDQQCADVPGTTCVGFFAENMAPPTYEHVGLCLSPP